MDSDVLPKCPIGKALAAPDYGAVYGQQTSLAANPVKDCWSCTELLI